MKATNLYLDATEEGYTVSVTFFVEDRNVVMKLLQSFGIGLVSEEETDDTSKVEPANDNKPPRRGRRSRGASADTGSEADEGGTASGATEQAEQPASRRRRSRGAGEAVETSKSKSRRPRRSSKSEADDGATEKPAPARRRPRRGAQSDEPTAEDLAKAASEGARHLTPQGVMGILAELKAEGIGDLTGEDKQSFIDRINEEIACVS